MSCQAPPAVGELTLAAGNQPTNGLASRHAAVAFCKQSGSACRDAILEHWRFFLILKSSFVDTEPKTVRNTGCVLKKQ